MDQPVPESCSIFLQGCWDMARGSKEEQCLPVRRPVRVGQKLSSFLLPTLPRAMDSGRPYLNPLGRLSWVTMDQFSSVQSLSRVWLFVTPWITARQAYLSITNCQSLLKLMSIESVMPSNHLILCRSLLLLPSIFPSIRVFSNESVLHIRWPKYWRFSFTISPSNEHSGLISFRMDWLDLLAVQGTPKSLLQHHSSKTSILWRSTFFIVQLSHPYMTYCPHEQYEKAKRYDAENPMNHG